MAWQAASVSGFAGARVRSVGTASIGVIDAFVLTYYETRWMGQDISR
jgi:hypothetical protein